MARTKSSSARLSRQRIPDAFSIGKTYPSHLKRIVEFSAGLWSITGIATTGDAEDNAILVPLSFAQESSGHPGKFRQLFVSALTKPADALAERDPKSLTPTEYDRWFCSPYISSISYQIKQRVAGHGRARDSPRGGYGREDSVAREHAALDRDAGGADCRGARRGGDLGHDGARAARRNRHHEGDWRDERYRGGTFSG